MADARIFVNYRKQDEPYCAALIDERLVRHFGRDRVFRSSESIPPGADYVAELLRAVRGSGVLLAVIGPNWLASDESGRRLVDRDDDWVRRELAEAFAHGVRVIPILVGDALLPAAEDLPADIARLARCQSRRIGSHRSAGTDLGWLVGELAALLPVVAPSAAAAEAAEAAAPDPARQPARQPARPSPTNGIEISGVAHVEGDIVAGGKTVNYFGPTTGR